MSAKKWTPPPNLVDFITSAHNQGKKIVYIGFGSIVVSDPKSMTQCVIEAVVRSGVCAILSKGWSDRLSTKTGDATEIEEPLPPQIYPIQAIPHDWLFQRIDAACHHGGAGTTGASLRGVCVSTLSSVALFLAFGLQPVYLRSFTPSLVINSFGLIEWKLLALAPGFGSLLWTTSRKPSLRPRQTSNKLIERRSLASRSVR